MKLYWQVYGTTNVSNNNFYLWFVKGYIAQMKGKSMNWAKVVVSTTKKKVKRKGVKIMKSGGGKSLDLCGGEASTRVDHNVLFKSLLATKSEKVEPAQAVCSFGILMIDIMHVVEMHSLLENLLKNIMLKAFRLKGEKAKLFEKLIGIKFNMEYFKSIALETQDSITSVEC